MGELGTLLVRIYGAYAARWAGAVRSLLWGRLFLSFLLDRGSVLPVEFIVFLWDVGFLVRGAGTLAVMPM